MYSVIIPCAGRGSRTHLSINKLLHKVDGLHLIEYTLENFMFDPEFTEIILVVNEDDKDSFSMFTSNKIKVVVGGKTRQDSVFQGLQVTTNELIFVHDGARPLVSKEIIEACKNALYKQRACVVGIPLTDTIVEYSERRFHPVNRENKYLMQTPQCCYRNVLMDVFNAARRDNYQATDEIGLVEKYSDVEVHLVQGSKTNIKVTYKEDFDIFKKLRK